MPARNKTPQDSQDLAATTRTDPITGSIIQGLLENIAIEMGYKLMRMSYSSIIRESEDFGAAICDAQGRQLCECSKSTPLQSGPIPGYVRGIKRQLEARGQVIEPGDVILHNDPYNGASHSPDIGVCLPIFHADELIGFAVTTAHHLDIGSCQPGSVGVVKCVDSYAEGLQLRALKAYEAGVRNDTVWQMIADNVRVPDLVIGDLEAQVSACRTGVERMLEVVEEYGLKTVQDAVEDLFDYSERLMRSAIAEIPDGIYDAVGFVDGYSDSDDPALKNLKIKVTLTIKGDDLDVDLEGTAEQLSGHAINMPFHGTVDVAIWLTLRSVLLDSDRFGPIPQNDGLIRPITIRAPKGTIANPEFPAPTIARFAPGNVLADTVMHALAKAVPEQVSAGVANLKAITFSGIKDNQQWVHIEIFEGSYGGRYQKDGMASVDTLYANTRNNPIEDIESHVPLRVHRYEYRENFGGAGRWRGGANSIKEIEFLEDGVLSVEGDGHGRAPWGLLGGNPGEPSALILNPDHNGGIALPSMMTSRTMRASDRVLAIGGIGGGYGNPAERDRAAVLADIEDELIDRETAMRDYNIA
ncbi:MAG: hydantoinase B/oxoprolinase family protein [Alphaproteobacteria bacterium]|nr:MAG: hydantoinase B/oxoprolinase family protein [Alphaproteobacteria bacterium]